MYYHQLDIFIQIAGTGSFSKAADARSMPLPAFVQNVLCAEPTIL